MSLRTYVIDNGGEYSDHAVYFVEADPAVIEPLFAAYQKAWPETSCPHEVHRIIFTADQLDWRVDKRTPIAGWLDDLNVSQGVADITAAEEFRRLALSALGDDPVFRTRKMVLSRFDFWLRTP